MPSPAQFCRALAIAVVLLPARLLAAPGDLDTGFGTGGIAVIDLGGSESAYSAALDSRNRIVLVGSKNGDILVARVTRGGIVDTTFGNDYNADGTPDGYVLIDFGLGATESGSKVLIDSLDRIYVIGTSIQLGLNTSIVVRLLADGTPDTTFAANLTLMGVNYQCAFAGGLSGAFDANGYLYVLGTVAVPGSMSAGVFSAVDPDGNLSYVYCTEMHPSVGGDRGNAGTVVQSDGKPVFAGTASNDIYVARAQALSQSLDYAYGTSGFSIVSHLAVGSAQPQNVLSAGDMTIDADPASAHFDKPVVVGSVDTNILALRFDISGALDSAFHNGDGWNDIDFGGVEYGKAVALDNNGRIVVAGESDSVSIAVARLRRDGFRDFSFGPNGDGKLLTNPSLGTVSVSDLVINSNGRILVVGGAHGHTDILLVRYLGGN
jgi:uncharacterized delta-60 repeat protein